VTKALEHIVILQFWIVSLGLHIHGLWFKLLLASIRSPPWNFCLSCLLIMLALTQVCQIISHFSTVGPNGSENGKEWFQLHFHLSMVQHSTLTNHSRPGIISMFG